MVSVYSPASSLQVDFLHGNLTSCHQLLPPASFSSPCWSHFQFRPFAAGLKIGAEGGGNRSSRDAYSSELLRRPVIEPLLDTAAEEPAKEESDNEGERKSVDGWVDWEDVILEETAPLVGLVRMILHSGKYEAGDRLSPKHESTILERILPHHPEYEMKIGCGVDYITIGYHPIFGNSRCLFIVRRDGESVDFSYQKCIKALIRKNYPLYADSFILRHFRGRNKFRHD
nr:protein DCL, chloroplastic-like [Ipomoea batatas]